MSYRDTIARELYEVMLERARKTLTTLAAPSWDSEPEALRDDWRTVAEAVLERFQMVELAYAAGQLEMVWRHQEPGYSLANDLAPIAARLRFVLEHAGAVRFAPELMPHRFERAADDDGRAPGDEARMMCGLCRRPRSEHEP